MLCQTRPSPTEWRGAKPGPAKFGWGLRCILRELDDLASPRLRSFGGRFGELGAMT
jgi:hypothetical protein